MAYCGLYSQNPRLMGLTVPSSLNLRYIRGKGRRTSLLPVLKVTVLLKSQDTHMIYKYIFAKPQNDMYICDDVDVNSKGNNAITTTTQQNYTNLAVNSAGT